MISLALDTSSARTAVAVVDGERVCASDAVLAERGQGETLAPLVRRVLEEAGVEAADRVVVGVGPGPFTGLRVGLVTAQVIARVWGVPVVGVCSLDALAHEALATRPGGVLVAADALRSEVYWAEYDDRGRRVLGPAVDAPAAVAGGGSGRRVVGAGAHRYRDVFVAAGLVVEAPQYPEASTLVRVLDAHALAGLPPLPLYLREPDAAAPAGARP